MRSLLTLAQSPQRSSLDRGGLERRLALALTICAIVAGIATYAVISRAPLSGGGVRTVLVLLNVDLILLLGLGIVVARRIVAIVGERQQGLAGSRLHVRLVALFGLLAATPAVVVAIFSVVFLSSGLESWFSDRVSSALDNSLAVAEADLGEHREVIRADALAMAADLEREGAAILDNPAYLRHLVVAQAALRSLTEAIVFDGDGRVLAYSGLGLGLELEQLPADVVARAERGEVVTLTSAGEDRIRAVLRLPALGDIYLFVGRFVDPQVLGFMDRTQRTVAEYRQLQSERSGIQVTSALIFGIVALLLLVAAIWVGINVADRLVTPIARLINAADRVRQGDLAARVPESGDADEVELLSRAFNRMTDQLESQRRELVLTNQQLDERRRFSEAVLAGVSAGIVGLDADRRILLPNRLAREMLSPDGRELTGIPIEQALPEIIPLFDRLLHGGETTAHEEIVLERGGGKRILLVRVAAQVAEGRIVGYVLTFDDVTELVSAQRQAAWSEVARRIAHEIKNPLTPIRLSAERLSRRFSQQIDPGDRDTFARSVSTIIKQVDAIGRLVSEFSAFARMPQPTMRFESLSEILRNALVLQKTAWPRIDFQLVLPADDPLVVPCDAEKLGQVFTNLLQNAINALNERPAEAQDAPAVVRLEARRTEGGVAVDLSDSGPGFPAEAQDRFFEPYFTTRTQGTGLGLAIVKKIMEEHHGKVELGRSGHGGGLVRLWFPVGAVEPVTGNFHGAETSVSAAHRSPERSVLRA